MHSFVFLCVFRTLEVGNTRIYTLDMGDGIPPHHIAADAGRFVSVSIFYLIYK